MPQQVHSIRCFDVSMKEQWKKPIIHSHESETHNSEKAHAYTSPYRQTQKEGERESTRRRRWWLWTSTIAAMTMLCMYISISHAQTPPLQHTSCRHFFSSRYHFRFRWTHIDYAISPINTCSYCNKYFPRHFSEWYLAIRFFFVLLFFYKSSWFSIHKTSNYSTSKCLTKNGIDNWNRRHLMSVCLIDLHVAGVKNSSIFIRKKDLKEIKDYAIEISLPR